MLCTLLTACNFGQSPAPTVVVPATSTPRGVSGTPVTDATAEPGPEATESTEPSAPTVVPTRTLIPGGLPSAETTQSPQELCNTLANNYPEDRSRPEGDSVIVTLATQLIDRFKAASLAMRVMRDAPTTEVVRCASQTTLDVLVGRTSRVV